MVNIYVYINSLSYYLKSFHTASGVLNGPDIRKLMKTQSFDAELTGYELIGWNAIKRVIKGFLGNNRSNTYKMDVTEMLYAFEKLGVNMSLKIHFLHFHLEYFERQLPTESDEQGERYHQVSLPFEIR